LNSTANTHSENYSAYRLALVIPFYNEEKRITVDSFTSFAINNRDILFVLVNDGSTDRTHEVLQTIHSDAGSNTEVVSLPKNIGKGNAIRAGMLKVLDYNIPFIAYIDGDLSTPFEEILRLYNYFSGADTIAVLGSRLKKLDSYIKRSLFRHISGRLIATIIDSRFKIGCYDTQCSAKIFRRDPLQAVIQKPFYTRWFFDVELLLRIRKKMGLLKALEVPLNTWEHKPGSKINALSVFSITKEIYMLFSNY
jgi:glycosyltransferase involved in cell wall biosynthesis